MKKLQSYLIALCLIMTIFIFVPNALADDLLISQTCADETECMGYGDSRAQSFVAVENQIDITRVCMYFELGSTSGSCVAGISTTLTDNYLNWLDYEIRDVEVTNDWVEFNVDCSVTPGNTYYLIYTIITINTYSNIGYCWDADPYPPGEGYWSIGDGWYPSGSQGDDYGFKIYGNLYQPDIDPPTPNPSTWSTNPYATSSTSISMTATTASDPSGGVQYYFEETTGHSGGSDSGWQPSRDYTDDGLQPNTQYTYRVRTRDVIPNTGEWSTYKSETTLSLPDLTISNVHLSPEYFRDGDPITLKFDVNNEGDEDAGPFVLRIKIDDIPKPDLDCDGLAANTGSAWSAGIGCFNDYDPHEIEIYVDVYEEVNESDETNGYSGDFKATRPDLIVESVTTDPRWFPPGATFDIPVVVKNIGGPMRENENWYVGYQLDNDNPKSIQGEILEHDGTVRRVFTDIWPSDFQQHTIKITADSHRQVPEEKEYNNEYIWERSCDAFDDDPEYPDPGYPDEPDDPDPGYPDEPDDPDPEYPDEPVDDPGYPQISISPSIHNIEDFQLEEFSIGELNIGDDVIESAFGFDDAQYRYGAKIKNIGSTDISGYLRTIVYYFDQTSEQWGYVTVDDPMNDEITSRTINSGKHLALGPIFMGLVHTRALTNGNGNYRVYAVFGDSDGNVLKCADDTYLVAKCEFTVTGL